MSNLKSVCKKDKTFGYDILLDQWENTWKKGLKFMLNFNLKEHFYKMMNCCHFDRG